MYVRRLSWTKITTIEHKTRRHLINNRRNGLWAVLEQLQSSVRNVARETHGLHSSIQNGKAKNENDVELEFLKSCSLYVFVLKQEDKVMTQLETQFKLSKKAYIVKNWK